MSLTVEEFRERIVVHSGGQPPEEAAREEWGEFVAHPKSVTALETLLQKLEGDHYLEPTNADVLKNLYLQETILPEKRNIASTSWVEVLGETLLATATGPFLKFGGGLTSSATPIVDGMVADALAARGSSQLLAEVIAETEEAIRSGRLVLTASEALGGGAGGTAGIGAGMGLAEAGAGGLFLAAYLGLLWGGMEAIDWFFEGDKGETDREEPGPNAEVALPGGLVEPPPAESSTLSARARADLVWVGSADSAHSTLDGRARSVLLSAAKFLVDLGHFKDLQAAFDYFDETQTVLGFGLPEEDPPPLQEVARWVMYVHSHFEKGEKNSAKAQGVVIGAISSGNFFDEMKEVAEERLHPSLPSTGDLESLLLKRNLPDLSILQSRRLPYERALKILDAAIERDPFNESYFEERIALHVRHGRYDRAVDACFAWRIALNENPVWEELKEEDPTFSVDGALLAIEGILQHIYDCIQNSPPGSGEQILAVLHVYDRFQREVLPNYITVDDTWGLQDSTALYLSRNDEDPNASELMVLLATFPK